MSVERILAMRRLGYKVGRIAEDLGLPLKEVIATLRQNARGKNESADPTEEEIAERKMEIRR